MTVTARWSIRAVARAAGVNFGSARNLMRDELGLFDQQQLTAVDVVCLQALVELGANRPTNRDSPDDRTAELLHRDRRAVRLIRDAHVAGRLVPPCRLLAIGTDTWLSVKDLDVLSVLDQRPEEALRVLPVGAWMTAVATSARVDQGNGARDTSFSPAAGTPAAS